MVRKWSDPVDARANMLFPGINASSPLKSTSVHNAPTQYNPSKKNSVFPTITVPGGNDGPSGVLVCSENFITYKHQRSPSLRIPIPRRRSPLEDPSRGLIIVSGVMHKMKGFFFFLLQSEEGDVYKVTLEYDSDTVTEVKIKYFDTLPVAASLCILRAGFLFVGAEFGDQ